MEEKNGHLNHIIKGGLLLTASSFIAKLLSALYKVPFQNLTGDAGFYVYQQIYPIYGLAVGLTLTGLPTFVSKIVSEAKEEETLKNDLRELNTLFMAIGLGMFLLLQFGATAIAQWMGDIELTPVIQTVSLFFLFLPFLALIRGYFQGRGNMLPTSMSQVIEQLVRVLILLAVAFYFTKGTWSVYEMGANAYHSAWLSALFGSGVLFYYLYKSRSFAAYGQILRPKWSFNMSRRLFTEGILLIATSSLMILFQFIDSFTVFNGLVETGISNEQAMMLKGIYDRGQPLVQLGLVVGLGFSTTSLPVLRKRALANNWPAWTKSAASVIRITILLSLAATVGLIAIMPAMNYTLFTDYAGTRTLQIFVASVFLASMVYCLHTILQSTGGKDYSLMALLIGLAFKMMMNKLAVRGLGIAGSSIVTVFSLLIICVVMLQMIPKAVWKEVFLHHFIGKMLLLSVGMYGIVSGSLTVLQNMLDISSRLGHLFLTLIGVLIGAVVYIGGALWLNVLSDQEMEQLPLPSGLKKRLRK